MYFLLLFALGSLKEHTETEQYPKQHSSLSDNFMLSSLIFLLC